MAQLISLTGLSENNVTRTGAYLFNVGRMTDIFADGSHCRFSLTHAYCDTRIWLVDHTYATVAAAATNYIAGTKLALYILTSNKVDVNATRYIVVDRIVKAWANPADASQSVIEFMEEDNKSSVLLITNITLAALATAASSGGTVNLYQGVIACNANPNYPAAVKDQYWKVSVAGFIGGGGFGVGTAVEVGDDIICIASNAGGTEAAVGASFMIVQRNMIPTTATVLQGGTNNTDFVTAKTLADQALTFGVGTVGFTGTITNSGTINATTFDTNVAAAAVTLGGTTLQADGTDAAIPITINAKGTGSIIVNSDALKVSNSAGTGAGIITSILNQKISLLAGDGGAGVGGGGDLDAIAGAGGATSGHGGSAKFEAGSAATDGRGGTVYINGGSSKQIWDGGGAQVNGGAAGTVGNGGSVALLGGNGGTTSGNGGNTGVIGGDAITLGNGGSVTITVGTGVGVGGVNGSVIIDSAGQSVGVVVGKSTDALHVELARPTLDGNQAHRVARATYDFAEHGGAISTIGLGVFLPDNAVVTRTWFKQHTAFVSTGAPGATTIEFGYTGNTAILVAQAAENNAKYAVGAISEGVQTGTAANMHETTAKREIAITIGATTINAGKAIVFCEYVVID